MEDDLLGRTQHIDACHQFIPVIHLTGPPKPRSFLWAPSARVIQVIVLPLYAALSHRGQRIITSRLCHIPAQSEQRTLRFQSVNFFLQKLILLWSSRAGRVGRRDSLQGAPCSVILRQFATARGEEYDLVAVWAGWLIPHPRSNKVDV